MNENLERIKKQNALSEIATIITRAFGFFEPGYSAKGAATEILEKFPLLDDIRLKGYTAEVQLGSFHKLLKSLYKGEHPSHTHMLIDHMHADITGGKEVCDECPKGEILASPPSYQQIDEDKECAICHLRKGEHKLGYAAYRCAFLEKKPSATAILNSDALTENMICEIISAIDIQKPEEGGIYREVPISVETCIALRNALTQTNKNTKV